MCCGPPKDPKKNGKTEVSQPYNQQRGTTGQQQVNRKQKPKPDPVKSNRATVPPPTGPGSALENEPNSDNTVKDVPDQMPFYMDDNVRELYFTEEQLM